MTKIILSEKQKQIVEFGKGPLLIIASAGTGKTRVLTERICRLSKITRRKILAITFTNKASAEIKERLEKLDESLLEKVEVGTFHSFCTHVLSNHGYLIGYDSLPEVLSDFSDQKKLAMSTFINTPSLCLNYNKWDEEYKIKNINEILEFVSKVKRNAWFDKDLYEKDVPEEYIIFFKNYNDLLCSLNLMDYDDLLYHTFRLFLDNPKVAALYARNYEYVCIDEAQDLNRVQYLLIRSMIFETNNNLMLVGDSNQSIYGFNDSSAQFMMEHFKKDFNPKIMELTENFRSSKAVLEYANRIIPNASNLTNVVFNGLCEENSFNNPEEEAEFVLHTIKGLIKRNDIPGIECNIEYQNISILARNKYVLIEIEELLKKNNIPYYYKTSSSKLEMVSNAGQAFLLSLLVKSNPRDTFHLKQICSIYGIGASFATLKELSDSLDTQSILHTILEKMFYLKEDGTNLPNIIKSVIEKIVQKKANDNEEELNLAAKDFNEILNHWYKYSKRNNTKSLGGFLNAISLGLTSDKQEKEGIALSTVHTMKGQESDIIFLIGMDDQTFPDYRALRSGGVNLLQEKNNLYVAITRARRNLYISYPQNRKMPWGDYKPRNRSSLLP